MALSNCMRHERAKPPPGGNCKDSLSLSHTPDMGMKPEVKKPKLWSNHKAEAQTQALTFWKHGAEAKDGAEVLLSYYKYPFTP